MNTKERAKKTVVVHLTDMHGNPYTERRCTDCRVRIVRGKYCLCYTERQHKEKRILRVRRMLKEISHE